VNIDSAIYRRDADGYPFLDLILDSEPVSISRYQLKPSLVELGYVSLGPEWNDRLPEINLPRDEDSGRGEITLRGFTDDPGVVELARRFLNDDDFKHGKVLL